MSRTARLTDLLRDRTNAVAMVGAVAALAGVGSASAASLASGPAAHHKDTQAVTTAAHKGAVHPAVAHHSGAQHAVAKSTRPTRPYTIYDSVTPSALPAGHVVATYATGGFAVPASQVAGKQVVWIDTNGSDPRANALDVEPGDATPAQAATWAAQHLRAEPGNPAIIYTMRSDWPAAQSAVAGLPHWMQHKVRWWIADPTGVPHIVPGASATQWYWGKNIDLSMAAPNF
jgi:hypothetical protein